MKKTLGGDRVGSGQKMKVELHNYGRSTHNQSFVWRSTMSAGTLVPFLVEIGLPGTTFDFDLDAKCLTHPTIGPLFGRYRLQFDAYQCPIRLYQGWLHNNKLGIGLQMQNTKLPLITLNAYPLFEATTNDLDNAQINPSHILSYLGIRGVGMNTTGTIATRDFNGIPLIAYWDIYKNYYANKQEEIGAVIHTPPDNLVITVDDIEVNGNALPQAPTSGLVIVNSPVTLTINFTGTQPLPYQIIFTTNTGTFTGEQLSTTWTLTAPGVLEGVYDYPRYGDMNFLRWDYISQSQLRYNAPIVDNFPLENIDHMREYILNQAVNATPVYVNNLELPPYSWAVESGAETSSYLCSQEGLGIKTYQSDLFNNWLQTEWIDGPGGINEITAIDTSSGSFTIDALILGRKVYNMMNRIAVSGGSYDDWIDAVYTHERYVRCETPMYMGGMIKELEFQEVVSNSESQGDTGTQPLGTLAGKGTMSNYKKGGRITIKIDEPSYVMMIASITPIIDYSQGNKWHTHLLTMDDFHKPALDEIGFQELITEQMAWFDTVWNGTTWVTRSAGKQPAWVNYMTNVNEVRGNFAIDGNEMFMTLNRKYGYNWDTLTISDLTTYIDPVKFNNIFAQTSLDAQNFWMQIAIGMTSRRKMSAKLMPNL